LVIAIIGRTCPLSANEIQDIAALQQAITAIEAVIVDLDAEEHYPEAVVTMCAAH
jgi:hypothetical protein